ncbi:MAG: phytanoyl-CoA dioxygenase family protein [Gammaproteobacteria bacterium]|nr:phytanoyl-CoA dioxygenase family protein [Gammaproteobacteria bacterium]
MPERLNSRLSTVFEPPSLAEDGVPVSEAEIEFFKDNGFLFKRDLIEPELATKALDQAWRSLVESMPPTKKSSWKLERDDPASWRSPQWAEMPPADTSGPFEGRQRTAVHGRTVKMHEIGSESFLVDLVPNNPRIREIARRLLADNLKKSERTRGVYAFFPSERLTGEEMEKRMNGASLGPHTDRVCQQLNVCAYLDDVPPRSGGFTVYPGSHRIMFRAHRYEANWSPTDAFNDAMREVVAKITPVEFAGLQGDVVFWHGRTVHTAGIHVGDSIRWAVFADFTEDREILDANAHRELGLYEWFKDAKLFKNDEKVGADMWQNWRLSD